MLTLLRLIVNVLRCVGCISLLGQGFALLEDWKAGRLDNALNSNLPDFHPSNFRWATAVESKFAPQLKCSQMCPGVERLQSYWRFLARH